LQVVPGQTEQAGRRLQTQLCPAGRVSPWRGPGKILRRLGGYPAVAASLPPYVRRRPWRPVFCRAIRFVLLLPHGLVVLACTCSPARLGSGYRAPCPLALCRAGFGDASFRTTVSILQRVRRRA